MYRSHLMVLVALLLGFAPEARARTPGAPTAQKQPPPGGPTDDLRALGVANGLLNRGLFDLAEAEYRAVLAGNPGLDHEHTARYGLAVCLFRLNRLAEAATELAALVEIRNFAYAPEVGVMLGRCLLAQNRPADAAAAFERVCHDHAAHDLAPDATVGAIEALYRSDRFAECRDRARAALANLGNQPLRHRAMHFLALAQAAQADHAGAAETMTALIADAPAADLLGSARMLLGECHAALGAHRAAIAAFDAIIAEGPPELILPAELAAADALYRAGQPADADARLERVLAAEASADLRDAALVLRGHVRFAAGRYAEALAAFETARADHTASADLVYWMGKCKLRLGEPADAAGLFDQYIRESPEGETAVAARYDQAVALVECQRLADARQRLTEFLKQFPQHPLAPDALHLAAVAAFRDQDDTACSRLCTDFQQCHADHALAPDVLLLAIECADRAGRWADVLAGGVAFTQRHPSDARAADAAFRAGLAACRLERYDDAERQLATLTSNGVMPERFAPAALALGDIHFQGSDWLEADAWLTQYLASAPQPEAGDDALLKRGLARVHLDRHREAVADFEMLAERWPQSAHVPRAHYERGQALGHLGDTQAAEAAFALAGTNVGNSPLGSLAAYQQAVLALQAGDHARAMDRFSLVIAAADSDERCGEALFQRGQCRLASGDAPAAEADFAALLERHPQHARALTAQAWRIIALARQDQAAAVIDALAQLPAGADTSIDPQTRAALLHERAWALRATNQPEEASRAYAELLALPELDVAQRSHAELALAELAINGADCTAARDRLVRLVGQSAAPPDVPAPVRERALYRLGLCAADAAQWEEAAARLDALLIEFPTSPYQASALLHCGEANLRLGRLTGALAQFERVLRDHANTIEAGLARLRSGECLAAMHRWVDSERVLAEFLEQSPDHARWFEAQFGIGWARENQQRRDEAIAAYRVVVERHQGPTAARAQFQIGECLFAGGDHAAAARELLKVDIVYGYAEWSAAALYEAGRCFEQMNRPDEARRQFEAVVARFADTHWAQAAAERLPRLVVGAVPGH